MSTNAAISMYSEQFAHLFSIMGSVKGGMIKLTLEPVDGERFRVVEMEDERGTRKTRKSCEALAFGRNGNGFFELCGAN